MKCPFDKDLLQEFAIGEIGVVERREVETHLAGCADCRLELAFFRDLARRLSTLPEPEFPAGLEEVLIRSSIQARRSATRHGTLPERSPGTRPAWIVWLGAGASLGILVLLVVLLWPGRMSSLGPVDKVVVGGVGQGLSLLDGVMRVVADLQASWGFLKELVARLAPVGRALQAVLRVAGGYLWGGLVASVVAAMLLLWRFTKAGQKRSVDHAKPRY